MKKKAWIVLVIVVLLLQGALPVLAATGNNVSYNFFFIDYRNEYRLDYWGYPSTGVKIHVKFTSPTSTVYESDFTGLTGTFYLTCNGTYDYIIQDSSGVEVASVLGLQTTQIVNGSCSSYSADQPMNTLNLTATDNGNGTHNLDWTAVPNATTYDLYKDGVYDHSTSTLQFPNVADGHSYTVRAVDSSGNTLAEGDVNLNNSSTSTGGGTGSTCNGCTMLQQMLTCPDWDTYMGDLTTAFKNALPPPPDWDQIADKIGAATVQHLSDYYGPVPPPPTQADVDVATATYLPTVDNSTPTADQLVPEMPPGYEQQKPFDITSGPQIDVVDDSKPFNIFDPLSNMTYDNPGVHVKPGDARNNSGGIQNPVVTGDVYGPQPTLPPPDLPNNPVPIPTGTSGTGTGPTPGSSTSIIPIPIYKGG